MEKHMLDKHEMKNAIDKVFSPESVVYHGVVKTNFSKLVLDKVSETDEGKKIVDCISSSALLWLLCLLV